ncbi:hypothetical protein SLS60_004877 [Paraconiothyrium brasiliense]|uniref:Alpha/beta hydrolase fold-3 domain-containing protein n=1 Tax=Paraconiothyrium brasiliense TaxID=300254 RepID=A0ABR3RLL1_9PLEO
MRTTPPQTATIPPLRTPRDARRASLDLNVLVPSASDQSRSVEAMVMSVPYTVKIKVLGRITPPLKDPGPSSPAIQVRGGIIAVEGEDQAAVTELSTWLNDFLARDKEYSPRIADPPKEPGGKGNVSFEEYFGLIQEWHGKSKEMIKYITTPVVQPSPPKSPESDTDKDETMKDTNTSPTSSTPSVKPVLILPSYQLRASDVYASRIPIQDVYSPMDHWQWMATLWRGTVGPDLTIYIKSADKESRDGGKLVDVNDEVRCMTVVKEGSGKFAESALRRVGFEVGEWDTLEASGQRPHEHRTAADYEFEAKHRRTARVSIEQERGTTPTARAQGMIDHVVGRPSVKFRKIQVLAVVSFWSFYLYRGDRHGPPLIRRISSLVSKKLTAWQTVLVTLLYLYIARNFGKLVGLESPEPLANLYSHSYFRATWVTTALDAGFWSAMRIRQKPLRDFLSIVFSVYYLICAEQADEKVRKVRATLTVEHLRVGWEKGTSPYLAALTSLLRPRLMWYPPRKIRIPRPKESSYTDPVIGWLYFNGPLSALKKRQKIVLDIPGGGFVAMNPRNHEDKLMGWAGKTGLPVLSLDYRKAPEWPYPYALNECYDVYHSVVATRGRCMGLSGESEPKIVVSGDSAGGNLAVGMTLMILQAASTETRRWQGERQLPPPVGVVLMYPALDMNIGNWMTDEQMALIRDRKARKQNRPILRHKSDDYRHLAPNTPGASDHSDSDDENPSNTQEMVSSSTPTSEKVLTSPQTAIHLSAAHTGRDSRTLPPVDTFTNLNGALSSQMAQSPDTVRSPDTSKPPRSLANPPTTAAPPTAIKTRLAMSSMISYFGDRILTPEMMRAMIILYIGPHNRPDFSTDFLLSPLLAPELLLAKFPRTWMLTGERDPLVDDTVIFAGRLRQAKRADFQYAKEMGLDWARGEWAEHEWVNVDLIPGISHGFLQFVSVFPEGWKYITRCGKWMVEAFDMDERNGFETAMPTPGIDYEVDGHHRARERSDYFGSHPGLVEAVASLSKPKSRARHHHRTGTTESSADDDRPLEMTVLSRGNRKSPPMTNGRGKPNGKAKRGRRKSLVSLASEDDLLGRRMKGLTSGLRGGDEQLDL